MPQDVEREALARYLEKHQLKRTRQREMILQVFLGATGHITSDEIFEKVHKAHPQIGHTTVYRTMKLLVDAGLANETHFEGGVTRYEIPHKHHDHLVCVRCGRIQEFECQMIESAQDEIAVRYGFTILRHSHELYGHCSDCQRG